MKTATLLFLAAATSFAVVPHRFSSGTPAKADSVNENFDYLEAAVKAKANQSGLDSVKAQLSSGTSAAGKANQSTVDSLKALVGKKADTTALNAVKASIPSAVNLSGYATTASVAQALGAKADTAALNAVKASIPSAVNLSGYATSAEVGAKADTSALNAVKSSIPAAANLSAYAKTADVAAIYAKESELIDYATKTSLNGYVTNASLTQGLGAKVDTQSLTQRLSGYQVSGSYLTSANLTNYVTTTALNNSLTGYASTAALNSLSNSVGAKLDTSALTTRLNGYATAAALTSLSNTVSGKASQTEVTNLTGTVATKAAASSVTALAASLGAKADSTRTIMFDPTTNQASPPSTASIFFTQGSTGWGSYIGLGEIGIWSGSDAGNIFFHKSTDKSGIALGYANRGGSGEIFATVGSTVYFNGTVVHRSNDSIAGNLRVAGNIKSYLTGSSIVPDYVFEPTYKLAPLSEVEAYTQENRHLPEVPSASEIAKGGLDLTEMNLTLLKKVEELTLHAIAQSKQIDAQAAQIQAQNERLRALEASRN